MQTHFLAPHMAERRLSGDTLLSVVGMHNSATAGGRGWDHGWHLQHCGSRTPGCHVRLPSCWVHSRPRRAIGADGAQFLARSNLQVGPRCQELTLEPLGQSQDPQGSGLGSSLVLNERPRSHGHLQTLGQHGTPSTSYLCFIMKLFWVVLDRDVKPGLVLLCRNELYFEIHDGSKFWLSLLTWSTKSQRTWRTQKFHHLQWT